MEDIVSKNKKLQKISSSPWAFFINREAVAWLAMITIIITGIFSLITLPRETQPQITLPISVVSTTLPGANPSDIETLITKPLEKAVAGLSEIKTLSSNSALGISIITIEFEQNANLDKSMDKVKDRIDAAKSNLPDDATDPSVIQVDTDDSPIITFSIVGERPLQELTEIAETLEEELKKVNNVSKINLIGGQKKQIRVTLNRNKIEDYGLNIQDISNIIKTANFNVPVGTIQKDDLNYSIRIDNRFQTIEQIKNLLVFQTQNQTPIYLSDIATVKKDLSEISNITKLSIEGKTSKQTVSLQVFKKKDSNSLSIVDETKEKMKLVEIPNDVNIEISNDNSAFIRTDLGILTHNGIQTTLIITLVLFLALGLREGLISGLSIPLTFLVTFTIMDIAGMTINSLTLFSLVIALGLMVDTAIVIMEGIHENLRQGYTKQQSALLSLETYKWPLIAGTITTISAFVPMLLVSGIVGEFLKALPITISAALFSSLFISLFIVPSITTKFLKKGEETKGLLEPFFRVLRKIFEKIISNVINSKSKKILIITICLLLFAGSLSLPFTGVLKVEMFPKTDVDFFVINIETPNGLAIEKTEKIVGEIEEKLYKIPDIKNFLTIIGSSQAQAQVDLVEIGGSTETHLANITVNLKDKEIRSKKSYETAEEVRELLKEFKNIKVNVRELSEGPPGETPITIRITGKNGDTLKEIATDIEKITREIPGTQNVSTSLESGLNELKFTLDRAKLLDNQISGIQVASLIRSSAQGIKSTTVNLEEDDIDIIIKYDKEDDLENISIRSPKGHLVTLGELGKPKLLESLATIQREDQKRIVKVRSDLNKNTSAAEVNTKIQDKLIDYKLPKGYEVSFGGDMKEVQESFNDLYKSMIVGIVLIAFTLVLMFNSFRQSLIILITLPLALIGVFPGLLLIGLKLSFPAFLGVVTLSGIVVNDAIVLIDKINSNIKEGLSMVESIIESSTSRLQPIIMTSLTTILGILPLAMTNEFWSGLGFSLIFGLTFSTLLTLLIVPILYKSMITLQNKIN